MYMCSFYWYSNSIYRQEHKKKERKERTSHLQMVMLPITDMFLASKPRKTISINFILIWNLFLARPKPASAKSRVNSDNNATSRARPAGSIPTRSAAATSISTGS